MRSCGLREARVRLQVVAGARDRCFANFQLGKPVVRGSRGFWVWARGAWSGAALGFFEFVVAVLLCFYN